MLTCFIQCYPRQRLGLGVLRTKIQQGHLHVLYRDLTDGPPPVACYGRDELLWRIRAFRRLEVGEGKVRRALGFLQVAARAQSIPQPVERPSIVRLDERRAGEGVEVREPDGEGWNVGQGDPGALLDLLQPLAADFILFPRLVHEEAEKYQRYVHEVVGVQRDEWERTQRLPRRFEALVEPPRLPWDYEGGREPVPLLPVWVPVPTELQTALADEALPHSIILLHPRTLAESSCYPLPAR